MGIIRQSEFESSLIKFWLEYNDGNRRITHLACDNQGTYTAQGTVTEPLTRLIVAQATFAPGTGTSRVALGGLQTLQVTTDEEGNVDHPYDVKCAILPKA